MNKPKTFVEEPGNSFNRFEKFVKKVLAVPNKEIDEREAEYQRTKKTAKERE